MPPIHLSKDTSSTYQKSVYEQLSSDYKEFIIEIDGVLQDESFISEDSTKDRIFGVFDPVYRKCESLLEAGELLLDRGHQLHSRYKNASFLKKKFNKDNKKIIENLSHMTEELRSKLTKLRSIYVAKNDALINTIETTGLEEGFKSVILWIKGPGDKLLSSQTEIGEDYESADKLRKVHEELELKCADTYSNYAELRHKVKLLIESGRGDKEDLVSQCDYMESVCRNFANILEKRRILVITSVRFHRFFEELSRSLDDLLRTLHSEAAFEDVQSAETALNDLEGKVEEILHLYDEAIEEGHELLNLLSLSVKNWVGQDVTPDRTKQIEHVERLLDALQQRQTRSNELAGARKMKLQQLLELRTCEQNAIQAIQWIAELCDTVNQRNSATPNPGERLTDYHNTQLQVHKTALETYNCGKELLQRALVLRRMLHQDLEANHEMMQDLNDTWKRFTRGELEHVQRLKNASLFHRNVDQFESDMNDIYQEMKMVEKSQMIPADVVWQNWHKKERIYQQGPEIVDIGKKLLEKLQEPVIREYGENREMEFMDETVVQNLRQNLNTFEDNLTRFFSDWENMFSEFRIDENDNLVDGDGNILRYAYQRKQEEFTPTHTSTLIRPSDSVNVYSPQNETLNSVQMREKPNNLIREPSNNVNHNGLISKNEEDKFFAERNKILNKYGRPYKPFSSFMGKKEDWYHEGTDRTLERNVDLKNAEKSQDNLQTENSPENRRIDGHDKWGDEQSLNYAQYDHSQMADVPADNEPKYGQISERPDIHMSSPQYREEGSYYYPQDSTGRGVRHRIRPQARPLSAERVPFGSAYDNTDRRSFYNEEKYRYSDPKYGEPIEKIPPRDSGHYSSSSLRRIDRLSVPQEQFNRTEETPVQTVQDDDHFKVDSHNRHLRLSKNQRPNENTGYLSGNRDRFSDPTYNSHPSRKHQQINSSHDPTKPLFIDTSFHNGVAQQQKPLTKYDPEYERLASDYHIEERQPTNSGTFTGPWYQSSPRVIPMEQPNAPYYAGAHQSDDDKGNSMKKFSEQYDHRRTEILDNQITTIETLPDVSHTQRDEYSDKDDSVFIDDDQPRYSTIGAPNYVVGENVLEDPTELVVFPHCGTRTHFPLSGLHPDQPKNTFPIINDERRYLPNEDDNSVDKNNVRSDILNYQTKAHISPERYQEVAQNRDHPRYHDEDDFLLAPPQEEKVDLFPAPPQQEEKVDFLPEQERPIDNLNPKDQQIFKSGKLIRLVGKEKPRKTQDELDQELYVPRENDSVAEPLTYRNKHLDKVQQKTNDDSLLSDSLENEYDYNKKFIHQPHQQRILPDLQQFSSRNDPLSAHTPEKNQENLNAGYPEEYSQYKEYPSTKQDTRGNLSEIYEPPREFYDGASNFREKTQEKLPIFGITGAKTQPQKKDEEFRIVDQNELLQRDERFSDDFPTQRHGTDIENEQPYDKETWNSCREPKPDEVQDHNYRYPKEEQRYSDNNFRDYRMYSTEIPRDNQRFSENLVWPRDSEYHRSSDKYLDQSITEIIDPHSTDDRGIHDESVSHLSRTSSVVLENRLEKVTEQFARSLDPNKSLDRLQTYQETSLADEAFIESENQDFWNKLNRKFKEVC